MKNNKLKCPSTTARRAFAQGACGVLAIVLLCISSSTTIFGKSCATEASIPFAVCDLVENRLNTIQADFDVCCQNLQDACDQVNQTLLSTFSCEQGIPIDQSFIDTATPQITQSGVYCLTQDVTTTGSALVIDADNVVLDLNGFTMSGGVNVIVATGHTDLQIINGKIDGTTSAGIFLTTCTTVTIENIDFTNTQLRALHMIGVNVFVVQNCSEVNGNTLSNAVNHFEFVDCSTGRVTCCSVVRCTSGRCFAFDNCAAIMCSGLLAAENVKMLEAYCAATGSQAITFTNCVAQENTSTAAMRCFDVQAVNGLVFRDCQALGNSSDATVTGFSQQAAAANVVYDNCSAVGNQKTGAGGGVSRIFFGLNGRNICFLDCLAKGNVVAAGAGGSVRGFDLTANAQDCYVANCIALGQTTEGFRDNGMDNTFFGNYAASNGTNFVAIGGPTEVFTLSDGTLTGTPVIWHNINAQP